MGEEGGIRHGFSRALYQRAAENKIKVTTKEGVIGFFDGEGRWIEGELYEADPELCIWLAAKRIDASHRLS
ncbi:MAG: hypothetical protein CL455_04965 [Acidimicrobiaceae bacterium]|jgi:hypothetical protein|nr:hypothetical protein [Acidimicrobiaceae bacterium]|tara:strand:+ start:1385 stop:1597 length:213 start_codon:yes stop_codon:yes gene_type:complete